MTGVISKALTLKLLISKHPSLFHFFFWPLDNSRIYIWRRENICIPVLIGWGWLSEIWRVWIVMRHQIRIIIAKSTFPKLSLVYICSLVNEIWCLFCLRTRISWWSPERASRIHQWEVYGIISNCKSLFPVINFKFFLNILYFYLIAIAVKLTTFNLFSALESIPSSVIWISQSWWVLMLVFQCASWHYRILFSGALLDISGWTLRYPCRILSCCWILVVTLNRARLLSKLLASLTLNYPLILSWNMVVS